VNLEIISKKGAGYSGTKKQITPVTFGHGVIFIVCDESIRLPFSE